MKVRLLFAMENSKDYSSWLFDDNFKVSMVSLGKSKDLVVIIEGLASADYRAFLNTLEIVQLAGSPLAPMIVAEPEDASIDLSANEDEIVDLECRYKSSQQPVVKWYKVSSGGDVLLIQNGNSVVYELEIFK